MLLRRAPRADAEQLSQALRPWTRRLARESLLRWLLRGCIAGLAAASLVLALGWVTPRPESELRLPALSVAVLVVLAAAAWGAWPMSVLRRAAELDARLALADRLTTAYACAGASGPLVALQREDAIARLAHRLPDRELSWQWSPVEKTILAGLAGLTVLLLLAPSPMQSVLRSQAAEEQAVQQVAERVETLRQEVAASPSLTPEQARRLDELLRQAGEELRQARSQQAGTAALVRAQQGLAEVRDPNASAREEAQAAMGETLAAEPLTRALGEALQREDPAAAAEALRALAAQADQLSDVQRQALSRALQRAANVGRGDPGTANALRDASRAVQSGESAQAAFSAAEQAMREGLAAAMAEAALGATSQRLSDLQAQLASGVVPSTERDALSAAQGEGEGEGEDALIGSQAGPAAAAGQGSAARIRDPSADRGTGGGAGTGPGDQTSGPATPPGEASENIYVPGRAGSGASARDTVEEAFSVRGQPRPFREVLAEYAQNGRAAVDRPDISPAVRDLVKQYFAQLEEGR